VLGFATRITISTMSACSLRGAESTQNVDEISVKNYVQLRRIMRSAGNIQLYAIQEYYTLKAAGTCLILCCIYNKKATVTRAWKEFR
jgi:hypothetical protein